LNRVSHWSDRQKIIQEPLFAGYLFVRIDWTPESRNAVLRKPGAVALVGSKGLGTPIPDKQIDDIKTLLVRNVEWKHSPFLRVGDKVRVRGGALDGMEGILLRENQDKTLVISVHAIQRSLSIRVTGYVLEKI
jgi:transcription antitermination factor NusG